MSDQNNTISDEEFEREALRNAKPQWEEWADDPAEIAKRQTRIMGKRYTSKLMRENYEDSFSAACYRAEIPKWKARLFMLELIEDITSQLIAGKIIHIPGLALFAVVPIDSANLFRVHFTPDVALRLAVSEEVNEPCKMLAEFRKRCHAIAAALPSYRKRGINYFKLTANERRKLGKERRQWEEDRALKLQDFLKSKYGE